MAVFKTTINSSNNPTSTVTPSNNYNTNHMQVGMSAIEPMIMQPSAIIGVNSSASAHCIKLKSRIINPAVNAPAALAPSDIIMPNNLVDINHHNHNQTTCSATPPSCNTASGIIKGTIINGAAATGHGGSSAHRWLEAMRDLSPPSRIILSRRTTAQTTVGLVPDKSDCDAAKIKYRAWMVKHPSAIDKFDNIVEAAAGKRIAIFLDYDGTLSPIVEDPERAFMSDEMRVVVKDIAALFPTSIITGRSREKVYEFVQLPELYYAGSHGMDIMGPAGGCGGCKANGTSRAVDDTGNEMVLFQPASDFVSIMDKVFMLLEENAKKIPGAKVEHNKFCVSVHFRCVKEENWLALAEQVQHLLDMYPNLLRLTQGRKILEIRPSIAWNKGKALDYLLRTLGLGSRSDVFPIYIGDDRTDEDAFKVIARSKHGLGILVSSTAKETSAMCSLRDPTEVLEFLRYLVKWRSRKMGRLYAI